MCIRDSYMGIYILTWFIGTVVLFISKYSGSVSYTHLDVYKRQVYYVKHIVCNTQYSAINTVDLNKGY